MSHNTFNRHGIADFARLYEDHAQGVLVYLARRTLDPAVAVDLMAETFAQALRNRRQYRGQNKAQERAWLLAIARNQLATYLRRGKAERQAIRKLGIEVPQLEPEDQARIEELAELAELRARVRSHFDELSGDQREALRLRVINEIPYPEVAERLAISEETARARVSRGLRRLAASLDRGRAA